MEQYISLIEHYNYHNNKYEIIISYIFELSEETKN